MFSASSLITAARTALWEVIRKHFCSYPLVVFSRTPRGRILSQSKPSIVHGSKFECEEKNPENRHLSSNKSAVFTSSTLLFTDQRFVKNGGEYQHTCNENRSKPKIV